MTDEITPFKRRSRYTLDKRQKALKSATNKLRKAENDLAKQKAQVFYKEKNLKSTKKKLRDLGAVVTQKKAVITDEAIQEAPPSIRDYLNDQDVIFRPHSGPQTEFLAASETEVFYGGARGGGKSYAMLVDPLRHCDKGAHRALLLRRTMPELRDLIDHSRRLYPRAYPGAKFKEQEKEWRFPSGARIEFGYAENLADALRYQGQSYTWIGVDELPQYPDAEIWNFLRSSLRSVDPSIQEVMRATGNPGNIGSHWVREMFIDAAPWGEAFFVPVDTVLGRKYISRRFIPAKLTDNPSLMHNDSYLITLSSLPEIKRKQFLEGDWDAFDNAAFSEFSRDIHVCDPFPLPHSWVKFRSCDWGYSSPACVLWFAVDYDNNLFVYRELYTKGVTADIFAQRVLQLENEDHNLKFGVMDASVWQRRGDVGPGIVETMFRNGCRWRPSDRSPNSRKNGKMEVHRRLAQDAITMQPKIKIFSTCKNLIRTLPKLPIDDHDIEDVDTEAEDHAYDALRYGCMSRPIGPSGYAWMTQMHNAMKPTPADPTFGY